MTKFCIILIVNSSLSVSFLFIYLFYFLPFFPLFSFTPTEKKPKPKRAIKETPLFPPPSFSGQAAHLLQGAPTKSGSLLTQGPHRGNSVLDNPKNYLVRAPCLKHICNGNANKLPVQTRKTRNVRSPLPLTPPCLPLVSAPYRYGRCGPGVDETRHTQS